MKYTKLETNIFLSEIIEKVYFNIYLKQQLFYI